jgi:hypothetical protein
MAAKALPNGLQAIISADMSHMSSSSSRLTSHSLRAVLLEWAQWTIPRAHLSAIGRRLSRCLALRCKARTFLAWAALHSQRLALAVYVDRCRREAGVWRCLQHWRRWVERLKEAVSWATKRRRRALQCAVLRALREATIRAATATGGADGIAARAARRRAGEVLRAWAEVRRLSEAAVAAARAEAGFRTVAKVLAAWGRMARLSVVARKHRLGQPE